MGNVNERLVRLPNAEAWVEKAAVVAVARQADSTMKADNDGGIITMINFSIRLVDGKSINLSSPDRAAVRDFLNAIGVTWDA